MRFQLEDTLRGEPDEVVLEDLRRTARLLGRDTVTMAEYSKFGRAHSSTVTRRFGSWFAALESAGLRPSRSRIGIPEQELFENIKSLWLQLGRQPRYGDFKSSSSRFSIGTYEKRFGSWGNALAAFVRWANEAEDESPDSGTAVGGESVESEGIPRASFPRTRREVSDRQRFRILVRDGFRCQTCGASPLSERGVELHVDHILPWSEGGETKDDNLQCKCARCNLGKGNAFRS